MKKKITICLAVVLTVALAISVLTACSLFGGDNNQSNNNNNQNETKTLNASESSSELRKAITASSAKDNYSIKIVGHADEGMSSVVNIEHDSDTQHITATSTQDFLGVTTNIYNETYLFTSDGKNYITTRVSQSGSFTAPRLLATQADYDGAATGYMLSTFANNFTLDASAEVTYEGTKKGTDVSVTATTVAEVSGDRTELFTAYTIKNGLIVSMLQRVSEYDDTGASSVKSEQEFTFKYDIGAVELAAGITVD